MLAVITVTGTGDTINAADGFVTLREAITAASTNAPSGNAPAGSAGLDEIRFNIAGAGPHTINVTGGQFDITESLKIVGLGENNLILDANSNSRIFSITTLAAGNHDVSISGLTLREGRAGGSGLAGYGGAIYAHFDGDDGNNENVDLDLDHVNIVANTSVLGAGGILFATFDGTNSNLTITNSKIIGNSVGATADLGGGGILFFNDGANSLLTIDNTEISGNVSATDGGGINVYDAGGFSVGTVWAVSIEDSTIDGNTAGDNGGGISVNGTVRGTEFLRLKNTRITNNTAIGSAEFTITGFGGGVFVHSGSPDTPTFTVDGCVLTGNTAQGGGGIYTNLLGPTASISNSRFIDNHAITSKPFVLTSGAGKGGAIFSGIGAFSNGAGAVTIADSIITDNDATHDGGGVAIQTFGVDNTYDTYNRDIRIERCVISENTAQRGGGVFSLFYSGDTLDIVDSRITGNHAITESEFQPMPYKGVGGGIYAFPVGSSNLPTTGLPRFTISGSSVDNNDAEFEGGGIFVCGKDFAEFVAFNMTISGNETLDATNGSGGGIKIAKIDALSDLRSYLTNVTITLNESLVGGGIYSQDENGIKTQINNSIVSENHNLAAIPGNNNIGGRLDVANSQFNIIGTSPNILSLTGGTVTNSQLTAANNILNDNPGLEVLRSNGGIGWSHALKTSSPAIDMGSNARAVIPLSSPTTNIATDQRGGLTQRKRDYPGKGPNEQTIVDIGAFELQAVPPALPGDYNLSGEVNAADYTVWRDQLGSPVFTPYSAADGNGNGEVDSGDYQIWKANFGASGGGGGAFVPGDYDQNGTVDQADRTVWEENLGSVTALFADGNSNGIVDMADLEVWRRARGVTTDDILPGDYSGNGVVDIADHQLWQDTFGSTTILAADGNQNGVVDAADYTIWRDHLGLTSAAVWPMILNQNHAMPVEIAGQAPQVVGLQLGGSESTHPDFDFASVVGSGEQLRTVPVGGLDTLSITFSEDVFITQGDLELIRMQGGSLPSIESFEYNLANQTATWTFASTLPEGQYLVRLSDDVIDLDLDALDGEFTNPWSLAEAAGIASTFPSGDGTAGGEFRFRFTNLAGDFNRNNVADAADYTVWADNNWRTTGALQSQGDADGDGDVGSPDHGIWSSQFNENYTSWKTYEPGLIQVSTLVDENDGNYSAGDLSLREALHLAKTTTGDETIVFAPGLTGSIVINSAFTIGADFDGNLTIDGPGADVLTIDSYSGYSIFNIAWNSGLDSLSVRGLTMKNSVAAVTSSNGADVVVERVDIVDGIGNAFYVSGGNLSIYDSEIARIQSSYAIEVYGGGTLTIANSSIVENYAVPLVISGGTAHIANTTFSGNYTSDEAGAIAVYDADVTLNNVTIAENEGSYTGGIYVADSADVTLHNSIVAGNVGSDIYSPSYQPGTFDSTSSHNLIGVDGTTSNPTFPTGNNNQLGVTANDLQLAPLDYYGGRTRSHMLKAGSIAIDAGDDLQALDAAGMPLAFDQRGLARITGGAVDVGAVEGTSGSVYTVTTLADDNDGDHSHGDFSLREAIATAALTLGDDTIVFAPSLTAGGAATITLTYDGADSGTAPDQLTIASNVTIDGPAANLLTVSGNNQTRVFQVNSGVTATIRDLRIAGGNNNTTGYGGGIYSSGTLTVDRSQIEGNTASSQGGGIYVQAGALTLTNSSVVSNFVYYQGGGLYISSGATATISNSTISTNTAYYSDGAGIYDASSGAVIVNSTVTANTTTYGTGAGVRGSATKLFNTIVAGNASTKDLAGSFHSTSSHNLIGYDSNLTNGIDHGVNGNLVGGQSGGAAINPLLSVLGYHGGTTKTHRLLSGSAAIDAGDNAVALAYALDDDQRGEERIVDWLEDDFEATVDIGAVELAIDEVYS